MFKILFLFIYLLAVLGLHCCVWAFSSWDYFSLWCMGFSLQGLLWNIGFKHIGFSSCGAWASCSAASKGS